MRSATFAFFKRKTMRSISLKFLVAAIMLFCSVGVWAQNPENWTSKQLIEPETLAQQMKDGDSMVIVSVGPGAVIPNSIDAGMARDKDGIEKFKADLKAVPKDAKVVIYCGCCPFEHCPNVRPAIDALKQMNFTNYYLLDLPHNIKTDWIDKGLPTAKN